MQPQPQNIFPLQPSHRKPQTKKSTVLQKVARKILAPIRSIPFPSSPTHSRSPSASSTSSGLQTPLTPLTPLTTIVQMAPSPSRPQLPVLPFPLNKSSERTHHNQQRGPFVFPPPAPASPSFVPPAPAPAPGTSETTSSIHRRRGAIVELPKEWYAKAGEYHDHGLAPTWTKNGVEAERIRRIKSFEAPPLPLAETVRSVELSLLGGMRRGKSAQAALGVGAAPAPAPILALALAEDWEQDRDSFDWRNSIGFSDDLTISFDSEDELDAVFAEV